MLQEHGFQVAAFDDLDAAVAGGEVPAGLAYSGGAQGALDGALVLHGAGRV
jgi:hypothetical protein